MVIRYKEMQIKMATRLSENDSETRTKIASADGTVQEKELSTQVHTRNPHMWELGRYEFQENMSQNKQRRKTQVFNGKEMMDVVVFAAISVLKRQRDKDFCKLNPISGT